MTWSHSSHSSCKNQILCVFLVMNNEHLKSNQLMSHQARHWELSCYISRLDGITPSKKTYPMFGCCSSCEPRTIVFTFTVLNKVVVSMLTLYYEPFFFHMTVNKLQDVCFCRKPQTFFRLRITSREQAT